MRLQVTRIAAQIQARAYGCRSVAVESEWVFGAPELAAPFTGSAFVEYVQRDVKPRLCCLFFYPTVCRCSDFALCVSGLCTCLGWLLPTVRYDYVDALPIPTTNTPPSKSTNTHGCIASEARAQLQLANFTTSGVVHSYCDGKCTSKVCASGSDEAQRVPAGYTVKDLARLLTAVRRLRW